MPSPGDASTRIEHAKQRWDLAELFKDAHAWRRVARSLEARLEHLNTLKDSGIQSAADLLCYLETEQQIQAISARLDTYTLLRLTQDTSDQEAEKLRGEWKALNSKLEHATAFIDPAILELGWSRIKEMLDTCSSLKQYRYVLETLERGRPHTPPLREARVLAIMSPCESIPYQMYQVLTEQELSCAPVRVSGVEKPVNDATIDDLLQDRDPQVRREAYVSYGAGYSRAKSSLARALISQCEVSLATARTRNFQSTFEEIFHEDDVDPRVFDHAVAACRQYRAPFREYCRLRAKFLGLEILGEHDIFAPLGEVPAPIPYEAGIELILQSLTPLGDTDVDILRRGLFQEGWADAQPRVKKSGEEFSAGAPGTKPYLNVNYSGSFTNLSTLAHEAGHSVHTHLTDISQPSSYYDTDIMVCETASNLYQFLLRRHILGLGDPTLSLAALEDDYYFMHRYLFIMPLLSRLERKIHETCAADKSVSSDELCAWTSKLFMREYGTSLQCAPEILGIKWAQFSHFYEPGYMYKYIIGIAAGLNLSERLLKGEPGLVERYQEFRRAGASMPPADIFKIVGIDLLDPKLYASPRQHLLRNNAILRGLLPKGSSTQMTRPPPIDAWGSSFSSP